MLGGGSLSVWFLIWTYNCSEGLSVSETPSESRMSVQLLCKKTEVLKHFVSWDAADLRVRHRGQTARFLHVHSVFVHIASSNCKVGRGIWQVSVNISFIIFTFLHIIVLSVIQYSVTHRYYTGTPSILDTVSAATSLTCALLVSLPQPATLSVFWSFVIILSSSVLQSMWRWHVMIQYTSMTKYLFKDTPHGIVIAHLNKRESNEMCIFSVNAFCWTCKLLCSPNDARLEEVYIVATVTWPTHANVAQTSYDETLNYQCEGLLEQARYRQSIILE